MGFPLTFLNRHFPVGHIHLLSIQRQYFVPQPLWDRYPYLLSLVPSLFSLAPCLLYRLILAHPNPDIPSFSS